MFKAILFDLNGTMINDMEYHTKAWFDILNNDLHANLSFDEVRKEMYGKNAELLVRVFGDKKFTIDEMDRLSLEKEKRYQKALFPDLKLIKGLHWLLAEAKAKEIKMAVASAAIPFNIDFVLDNLNIRHYFGAIVSANDVTTSKPHPETFIKAAALLNTPPEKCIVFEDVPKGVEAAQNAGMQTVVITTMHQKVEFAKYNNIIAFAKDYNDPIFHELLNKESETRSTISLPEA